MEHWRLCLNGTGFTGSHFLNSIRVQEARELLGKGSLNIGEIALKVGFNNTNHFPHVLRDLEEVSTPGFPREILISIADRQLLSPN